MGRVYWRAFLLAAAMGAFSTNCFSASDCSYDSKGCAVSSAPDASVARDMNCLMPDRSCDPSCPSSGAATPGTTCSVLGQYCVYFDLTVMCVTGKWIVNCNKSAQGWCRDLSLPVDLVSGGDLASTDGGAPIDARADAAD